MRFSLLPQTSEALGLLILRFGCAWFIFVWAVNKLLAPQQYQSLVKWIDKVDISLTAVITIAIIQIIICLCVFVGVARLYSYSFLAAIHFYTVYRQLPKYLDPFEVNENGFPVNRNVTVSLCALCAMLALVLLRHRDHWSLDTLFRRWRSTD